MSHRGTIYRRSEFISGSRVAIIDTSSAWNIIICRDKWLPTVMLCGRRGSRFVPIQVRVHLLFGPASEQHDSAMLLGKMWA